MNVHGIGILFSGGRGILSFENVLKDGWQRPAEYDIPHINKKTLAYIVKPEYIEDKVLLKKMRRADKFSKMAVIAASDAIKDSGLDIEKNRIGVILSTAFGAHQTSFDFLDDIIDYGEVGVSPITFSNSVHNAAASYIACALDITGPTLTVTRFFFSFQSALQLAQTWINDNCCDHVLVGAVDVCGEVMRYVFDKKSGSSADGKIRPFNFSAPSNPVPGEGSVFFLVSGRSAENAYCRIADIDFNRNPESWELPDIDIIDADGMVDGKAYLKALSLKVPAAAYSPLFGSTMTGSAFNCAAGALMIKKQMQYATPVIDNSEGLNLADVSRPAKIDLIRSIGYNCLAENVIVHLLRST